MTTMAYAFISSSGGFGNKKRWGNDLRAITGKAIFSDRALTESVFSVRSYFKLIPLLFLCEAYFYNCCIKPVCLFSLVKLINILGILTETLFSPPISADDDSAGRDADPGAQEQAAPAGPRARVRVRPEAEEDAQGADGGGRQTSEHRPVHDG